jgi:septum formation protein
MSKQIILASQSKFRKAFLGKLVKNFKVVESGFVEDMTLPFKPANLAKFLALGKAKEVFKRFPNAVVIGADTLVAFEGQVIGKPKNKQHAIALLSNFSGKWHNIYTGLAVISQEKVVNKVVKTKVKFRKLLKQEILDYVNSGEPMGKAGAYSSSESGAKFIEKISGDFYSIAGLPMCELSLILREFNGK